MVRFYILPNADHLQEDELNFEIAIRGIEIEIDAKLEDKRRALRCAYKTERKEPKLFITNLPIVEEVETLGGTLKLLKQTLRKEFDYTIVSRLRHYLIRFSSAGTKNEDEEKLKDEQCKKIEEFLRAYRQRVTYDPDQPNEETDLDVGAGAKALKESWRNPDPAATFQKKKQGSSRTGTFPKNKILDDDRETESDKKIVSTKPEGNETKDNKQKREFRPSKEAQKERRTSDFKEPGYEYDQFRKRQNNRHQNNPSFSSSDSDTDENDSVGKEKRKFENRSHNKSRGRTISSSISESSTDHEEERRRHRDRYSHRSPPSLRRSRSYRDDYFRNSRSRVESWDIVFSGDTRSIQVEDFLNRVKKLAKHERVGKEELLDKIHYKLKGEASDWWFTRESYCTTWEKFESEIRFRFGNPNRDRGIRSQLRELRQRRGETFVAFVTEVEKLNQCLKRPHSSRTIFEIVWENMRPHYRSKLATTRVHNLERLLELNHRIDANDPGLYRTGHAMRNEVHHIDAQSNSDSEYSSSEEYVVNALQRKLKISKDTQKLNSSDKTTFSPMAEQATLKCWNCQKAGHHWRACKERKLIFCYACGNIGRTTRTCERNHPQVDPQQQQQSLN
ncbi:uncharacterized protein LOC134292015 [Aedes albopictus]|uniref:CCHC-type domain-containing protein n=1 Tax=Aedes albopictus TaxID=7160 RepID=A0ABM1YR71_AEDAL